MFHSTVLLAVEEAAEQAALFQFDATLPLMALQFLILLAVLNALYFKPLGQAIDGRDDYVRTTLTEAKAKLEKAEALAMQYKQELAQMRLKSQEIITEAEAAATKTRNQQVMAAQQEAQAKVEAAKAEIAQEREQATRELEAQVGQLSQQVITKLLV
ncbi:MAG: F0F1 ATP synthase subunit B' [Cyanobacteria bacterium J06642_2]